MYSPYVDYRCKVSDIIPGWRENGLEDARSNQESGIAGLFVIIIKDKPMSFMIK
jgi:hypothetical protein